MHLDRSLRDVDDETVEGDQVGGVRRAADRGAAQERPHPAPELADRERLRDVVVRSELEPDHLVELVVTRGEHDDRHGAACAQAAADLEPVELREHQVEHDEIDVLAREALQRLLAVTRLEHAEALVLERIRQELLDGFLVVDQKDGGGVWHQLRCDSVPAVAGSYYRSPWRPSRPHRSGAGRDPGRSSGRSTAASTAAPGCSSACRCSLLAFSVARPAPLQPPNLPPAFDRDAAAAARARSHVPVAEPGARDAGSDRSGARGSATSSSRTASSSAPSGSPPTSPAAAAYRSRISSRSKPGSSRQAIVVMAHRDDSGTGAGANDNASGTAALLELARAYAPTAGAARLKLPYSLVFLSTDGAVYGGIGAAEFAAHASEARNVVAVLNLDAVAGHGRAATPVRRRHLPLARARARRDRALRARPGDRRPAGLAGSAAPAHRPRLPVQRLRAGAVRLAQHPGGDDHDRGRPSGERSRRHRRSAEHPTARAGGARDAERPRRDGAGRRAVARARRATSTSDSASCAAGRSRWC